MDTSPALPSLSLPMPTPKKKERKRKEKTVGWSQNAEAGSSKQPATVSVVPAISADEATATVPVVKAAKIKKRPSKKDKDAVPGPAGEKSKRAKAKLALKSVELKKEWECVPLAQSEVSRIPPVWTGDGRFYITAQNTWIHVHSASAPYARKSTLVAPVGKEHKAPITALVLSPVNQSHLISSSEDGTVKIWDLESGTMVHSIHIEAGKVMQMCVGEVAGRWEVFITVSVDQHKRKSSYRVSRFALPTSFPAPPTTVIRVNKLAAQPSALFISPSSLYLVALAANKAYTFLLPTTPSADWVPQLVKFVTDHALTCGAFAPTDKLGKKGEDWFATGDDKGYIRLWHGLGQAFRLLSGTKGESGTNNDVEKRLPTTSLHWHAHAVAAVAFTPSGAQLLSVGEESVLVQWHLSNGRREYIPRLGGRPIVSLAVRQAAVRGQEEEWWMAFADGTVVKVGAGSGRVENVGEGVKIDPLRQIDQSTPYPLNLHPSTSALVLPSSNPGTLQFINPAQTSLLFDLEVAPSNRISRRDDKHLVPVAVELVAFSDNVNGTCEWMATVEGRKGDDWEGGGDVRNLKIWRWDGQKYMVNTQFPKPHGISEITSLSFSPLNTPTSPELPHLLSTAIDGSAKLWHIRQAKKSEHGKASSRRPTIFELFWASRSSWNYSSLPIHSAAFSADATIVALAHGPSSIISLWDAESNVLLRALDASGDLKDVRYLAFVGEGGRYLAVGGLGGSVVWDLLSCEKTFSAPSDNISSLLPLPSYGTFLTTQSIASSTVISIYTPTSSTPTRSITVPHTLRTLVLLPSSSTQQTQPRLNFAAVAPTGELYRLGDDVSASLPVQTDLSVQSLDGKKERLSIWQEMFGEQAFLALSSEGNTSTSAARIDQKAIGAGRKSAISVYDGPSHTLPPAHLLFDGFMESILAGGSAPLPETSQEEGLLYELEGMDGVEEYALPEVRVADRGVGNQEVVELEGFFRGLLGLSGDVVGTKGKGRAINGNGNGPAGVDGEEEDHEDAEEGVKVLPTPNGKSNGMNGSTPKKPVEEEEEDRVVSGSGGAVGKKGKKRRAPKDAA